MPKTDSNGNNRTVRTGVVVGDQMDKTIVVKLDRVTRHRLYKKVVTRSRKVKAHDEENKARTGDTVRIISARPLSKDKRWRLVAVREKPELSPIPEHKSSE